jgi:ribose 5-phosphate isomerase A
MTDSETTSKQAMVESYKQQAAEYAVTFVRSGMTVGLGSGSTAIYALRKIAALLERGELFGVVGVPTSNSVSDEARRLGIPLAEDLPFEVDVTIDGADEVDPQGNLIKGGGGALLKEKIVAQASKREIIVVDDSKLSPDLGVSSTLPVEVIPFGKGAQMRFVERLGARAKLRLKGSEAYRTDNGNLILDCDFGAIKGPLALAHLLSERAGIVEHGLFLGLATDVIVAGSTGVRHLTFERRDVGP